jgi:hypothetical protein
MSENKKKYSDERYEQIPLTDKQKKILNKIYYKDGNLVGRDKLYKLIHNIDPSITRRQLMGWLRSQLTYQLYKTTNIKTDTIKLKIGDKVRKKLHQNSNERGGHKWSKKIYTIDMIIPGDNISSTKYKLGIKGSYLPSDLQKIDKVEGVLVKKKTSAEKRVEKIKKLNELYKDEEFEDEGETFKIIKVYYGKRKKYLVDYKDKDGNVYFSTLKEIEEVLKK